MPLDARQTSLLGADDEEDAGRCMCWVRGGGDDGFLMAGSGRKVSTETRAPGLFLSFGSTRCCMWIGPDACVDCLIKRSTAERRCRVCVR